MRICNNISPSSLCCGLETSVTLGTFDGVHLGHMSIIHDVIASARENNLESAVITFDRHPISVINPDKAPDILTTLDEKLDLIEKIGIDIAYIIHFTEKTAKMTAEEFLGEYLVECLGMRHFFVGYDHGFGKGRNVSSEMLKSFGEKHGFEVSIADPVKVDGILVSSSIIRDFVAAGNVRKASELLGRDYFLTGSVVKGHGVGKTIGFPTANLKPFEKNKLIPGTGVYSGIIEIDAKHYDAVISIGPRLTYGDDELLIEAHIPGFNRNIYGKTITLAITERLRDLVKFETEQELIKQITKDIEQANKNKFAYIK